MIRMAFVIEIQTKNPRTQLTEWRPMFPGSRVSLFETREKAERILHWHFPHHPATVRVVVETEKLPRL
jgi:hypothetical protein